MITPRQPIFLDQETRQPVNHVDAGKIWVSSKLLKLNGQLNSIAMVRDMEELKQLTPQAYEAWVAFRMEIDKAIVSNKIDCA